MVSIPLLLLGLKSAPSGVAAPVEVRQAPPLSIAADLPPYRIGYVSGDVPRVAAVDTSGGTQLSPLGRNTAEQPSARAGAVAFVRHRAEHADSDLAYLAAGETAPVALTADDFTDRRPALSPDGAWVAFESDRAGQPDLWLIRVNGTGLRRVTDHPADDTWPSWSPSGDRLAFTSTRDDELGDIYTVSVNGGAVTRVTTDPAADVEPAFAPSESRIAFTTTRFGQIGNLATVPAGGGEVTKLVAGEQAAWSPDGSALAFVGRDRDPSGDINILTLGNGEQRTLSARAAVAETGPTWSGPGTVLFTTIVDGGDGDVWSADALGQDRRDLTNRPNRVEAGPAYSPDGTLLAYAEYEEEPELGIPAARLVVSDADGRDRRVLTEFEPGRQDTDPTWSPDGRMIAFTRTVGERDLGAGPRLAAVAAQPRSSEVLLVRVADRVVLGSIPMPSPLTGEDYEPSWSPDGTRIALVRSATRRPSGPVSPDEVDRPAYPGGSTSWDAVISTPVIPPTPDIVLLIDSTGSMLTPIETVKNQLPGVVTRVQAVQPDARFAVATFKDGSRQPPDGIVCPGELFTVQQQLTASGDAARDAVGRISVGSGCDTAEDWGNALFEVSAGGRIAYRDNSTRIIVLVGDAPTHNPSPTPGGHRLSNVVQGLKTGGYRVIAVPVGPPPASGLDSICVASVGFCLGQASFTVQETNGIMVRPETGEIGEAILSGLSNLPVTVTPSVQSCDPRLTLTFDPSGPTRVTGGVPVHYSQTIRVAPGVAPGTTLICHAAYTISPSGGTHTVPITIRVIDPTLPLVTVDSVRAEGSGPDGVAVNYTATAVDSSGRTLTPSCTPATGMVFPVGQTLVTCTATDSSGRVGADTAYIMVIQTDAGPGSRIWVVTLAFPPAGDFVVTAQADLGTRVGAPCPAPPDDRAPAWSTDGGRLAFVRSGVLCVTDGSGGRASLPAGDPGDAVKIMDPAWSPDGLVIAFTWVETSGETSRHTLRTVPVDGGQTTVVIDNPGRALQPTFRPLPPTGLSIEITAGPQPGYVGGAPIVFTVTGRNAAKVAARRAWLSLSIPAELGAGPAPVFADVLAPGAELTMTAAIPASRAVAGSALATISGVFPGDRSVRAQARTPVVVIQPVLLLETALGPPGFVPVAVGTGFPPGATVTLVWDPGISARETVVVGVDGTLRRQVLVFHHDRLGQRRLVASGAGFGPVDTVFLVVPGTGQPQDFVGRR